MGAAGIAGTVLAGTSSARPASRSFGINRQIDVSSVSGSVTLEELLEPADLRQLDEDIDPTETELEIKPEAEVITLEDCCLYCCQVPNVCDCLCCGCDNSLCPR